MGSTTTVWTTTAAGPAEWQQQAANGHAALLAAAEGGHLGVPRRAAQGLHGRVQGHVDVPASFGILWYLDSFGFGVFSSLGVYEFVVGCYI